MASAQEAFLCKILRSIALGCCLIIVFLVKMQDTITLKTLFGTKKGGYIPPQEALKADPHEIMQNLQHMDKIDDKKLGTLLENQGSADGVVLLGDASISGVMVSNNNEDESVAPESIGGSVVPASRIFGGKRHGYGQNAPLKVCYTIHTYIHKYTNSLILCTFSGGRRASHRSCGEACHSEEHCGGG